MKKLDKQMVIEIVQKYITTTLTMEQVSNLFRLSGRNVVSKLIYHCIFYGLLSIQDEKECAKKIANNIQAHYRQTKEVNSSSYRRYNETIADRQRYGQITSELNQIECNISAYNRKNLQLEKLNSMNLEDYMSSEDERYYTPPSYDEDDLKQYITSNSLLYSLWLESKNKLLTEKQTLEEKYKI